MGANREEQVRSSIGLSKWKDTAIFLDWCSGHSKRQQSGIKALHV